MAPAAMVTATATTLAAAAMAMAAAGVAERACVAIVSPPYSPLHSRTYIGATLLLKGSQAGFGRPFLWCGVCFSVK